MDIKEKHEKMLYPSVRVRSGTAGGSGTVLYSELVPGEKEEYETYILTNHHVVEGNIKIATKFNSMLGRDVKTDVRTPMDVEFFEWEYTSWTGGTRGIKADIVAYMKELDLALLKLNTMKRADFVVNMFPKDEHRKRLRVFNEVYAVGCGMGHPPVATLGQLNGFDDIIDNQPYICSSAPTIFGNSGGALYLADSGEFIGVPSRITVAGSMFGAGSPITHLSYAIPIWQIYKFIDEEMFEFVYNDATDSKKCTDKRKAKRERDEKQMAIDDSRGA